MNDNLPSAIKKEIRKLQDEKKQIDEKIKHLEKVLGVYDGDRPTTDAAIAVRGGADIRPTVELIFNDNGNAPMRKIDVMRKVKELLPDMPEAVIERKMIHAVRTRLDSTGEYGKYRLKSEFIKSS